MKTIIKGFLYINAALIILATTSCEDYLDVVQDNRIEIDSKEKIQELLTNAYPNAFFAEFAESMSDNAGDKGPGAITDSEENEAAYKWEDINLDENETYTNYWVESYEAIAHSNQALASIVTLGETADLMGAKGEALLTRAYNHFMLVNLWAMRYDPSTADTELGVPYVTEPETEAIKLYTRNTVKEVYELIEKDLTMGLPLINDEAYTQPKFHFNKDAANAFAARFYLYKGEWEKVLEYSSKVLDASSVDKVRDLVAYSALTFDERRIRYSDVVEEANLLIAWTNSAYNRKYGRNRYALSNDILDLLFTSDSNPLGKPWAYGIFGTDIGFNTAKYVEYFKTTNPTSGTGFAYTAYVLFTIDELYLNRAEAYVMLENYESGAEDLNILMARKTRGYDPETDTITTQLMESEYPNAETEYAPFYTLNATQASFIKGIAELRRREFYHEGIRWFDIKRFDLVVTHTFFDDPSKPIVLPKGDPRRALQIPEQARSFGLVGNNR